MLVYLVCRDCGQKILLGKRYEAEGKLPSFDDATQTEELVGLKILHFLAAHVNHNVANLSDAMLEREPADVDYRPVDYECGDRSDIALGRKRRWDGG